MSSEARVVMVACALAFGACADFSRGEPSPKDGGGMPSEGGAETGGDGGVALSFATDVYPLLVPTCQMCHAPGQMAGDTQLLFTGNAATDYPTVLMFVDTSAPAGSRLLAKMTGNGHQGGTVYASGSPEYETVLHWIQQGAPQ
ncbi:MAG TPA: hypothetical protein VKQ32_04570 [Polyangia bacterium]|nr:hypothetical protein [Polyangia bacterium]